MRQLGVICGVRACRMLNDVVKMSSGVGNEPVKGIEVARAVATRPQLLLLDEVMAGLNNVEIDEALDMVRAVHATGVTVLLIEHVMRVIVGVCRRAVVLDFGQVLAEGEPEVVLRDERVIKAYLGERYAKRLKS